MPNSHVQSTKWNLARQGLIIVAIFQLVMILNYNYDLTQFINILNYDSNHLDIHIEDGLLGHTWDSVHMGTDSLEIIPNSIAVGMGITSSKSKYRNVTEISTTFPFFKRFLPSFCKTSSNGFSYNFFLAYDVNDKCFTNKSTLIVFKEIFDNFTSNNCPKNSSYSMHFVQCSHKGTPARAQNDAMMEAYMSNMEYYYRVNDDTHIVTPGWTEAFINTLKGYNPVNVGVVGPRHSGGNTGIMTYDFVHYNHINIFGCYYPRVFTGWYADNWITRVYQPGRSTKMDKIRVAHTMEHGTRYRVDRYAGRILHLVLQKTQEVLNRYIRAVNQTNDKPSGHKVISMSLSGKHPRFTFGAIRNAQLLQIYFPEWTMRVYISSQKDSNKSVPIRVLNKLKQLGVQLVVVGSEMEKINSTFWKYLVIHDKTVKYFLIRNTDSRFNDKDQRLTKGWMEEGSPCFSIKDLPNHLNLSLVDGFIGGQNPGFKSKIKQSMKVLFANHTSVVTFLEVNIWPQVKDHTVHYDSISDKVRTNMLKLDYNSTDIKLGNMFDEFDNIIKI